MNQNTIQEDRSEKNPNFFRESNFLTLNLYKGRLNHETRKFSKENMAKQYGFTLVELLIVIAIIAILAAMLLPALNSAKMKAMSVQCLANLKNCGLAELMYAQEYNDCIPFYRGNKEKAWHEFLSDADSKAVSGNSKICPSFSPEKYIPANNNAKYYVYGAYNNDYTTYRGGFGTKKVNDGLGNIVFWELRNLRKLSDHPLLTDSISDSRETQYFVTLPDFNDSKTSPIFHMRHRNSGNILFMDGHAKSIVLSDLAPLNSRLKTEWHPDYPKTFTNVFYNGTPLMVGY